MHEIRMLTDMDAAFEFYGTNRAAHSEHLPADATEGEDPALRLMAVSRETLAAWMTSAGGDRFALGAYDGDRLVGVAAGALDEVRRVGYLSYLCVSPDHRRQGIGNRLCEALEAKLASSPVAEKLEVVFHNPVQLPWYIPNGSGDWHPCMPGVDTASGLYRLLTKRGWGDFAIQLSYYRRLADYTDPPAIAETRARLLSEGIELTLYDPTKHRGLPELFDNIQNPGWKAYVLAHLDQPIVVAVDTRASGQAGGPAGGLVVSYTGPLSVTCPPSVAGHISQSKRGNFCGIGTRTEYRGRGIGKPVFCEMCRRHAEGLSDGGRADFMSLYTGENNPARKIYEAAGFQVVRRFADMRKPL